MPIDDMTEDRATAKGRHGRRYSPRAASALIAVALGAFGLSACGGGDPPGGPAVVRVGSAGIGKATIARWTGAIERAGAAAGFGATAAGTPRQRALATLIAAQWLRGEAAALGVAPSERAVSGVVSERREANGTAEFEKGLRASGQTIADMELEIEAELAAAAIRAKVIREAPPVTQAQALHYYKTHRARFLTTEQRAVDLVENLPSRAAAEALVSRVGTGSQFTKKALHEGLQRVPGGGKKQGTPSDITGVTRAIFEAPVGVASKPLRLNHRWTVFVVRKVKPSRLEPLSKLRSRVDERLMGQHRAEALEQFAREYRARWRSRTSCHPGYVVPGCAQYSGAAQPSVEPFAGS
jgi:hypothetical protein